MKERRERTFADMALDEFELDRLVRERFKAERHPEASVDGDDLWDRDLFEEDE